MPGDRYLYLGYDVRFYSAYVDEDTGKMLSPEPGGSYRIRAVDEGLVIPPGDGRWGEPAEEPAALEPPKPPPPLPPAMPLITETKPVTPATTEGSS